MRVANRGKQFETVFAEQWQQQFPKKFFLRLYDTTNGYLGVANPCDFLAMPHNLLFMIECKSHEGASIPFKALPQYDRLLKYKDMENVRAGFLIWFLDKDVIIWVPIDVAEKVYESGRKSIPYDITEQDERAFIVPSVKKKVFFDTDYQYLVERSSNDIISVFKNAGT